MGWNKSEVENIDSKRMRVDAMTERGEVRFSEECKHLLDIRDEIGTKGDKKHAKRKAKARIAQRPSYKPGSHLI